MAKIDTTKIEGYENLSAEEKLAKLEEFEFEDNSDALGKANKEVEKLKNSITKLSSENADWKRKYNEKLSDEEKAAELAKSEREKLENEYKQLKLEKELSIAKSNYLSLGYPSDLAEEIAKAQLEGDVTRVMEIQKKFIVLHDKEILAKAMDKTPSPAKGNGNKGITLEKFRQLSPNERAKFAADHPDEYKNLYAN